MAQPSPSPLTFALTFTLTLTRTGTGTRTRTRTRTQTRTLTRTQTRTLTRWPIAAAARRADARGVPTRRVATVVSVSASLADTGISATCRRPDRVAIDICLHLAHAGGLRFPNLIPNPTPPHP